LSDEPVAKPPRTWRRRVARIAAWTLGTLFALVVALVALVYYVGGTQSGLPYAIAQLERLSGGRLAIEGATGALLSTLHVATLRWRGDTTTLVAHDVVVDWDPSALARRELHVRGAGARAIELAVAASSGGPATLPPSLGLPLAVVVDHASVTTLDYALGERKGRVTGIAFAYRGDARGHRLDDVTLAFLRARITAHATLDAASPFALAGAVGVAGSDDWTGYGADATLGGTLARVLVAASGRARDARFDARAALTPFAAAPLDTLDVDATNVDPAAFAASLPHATLALDVHARPAPDGFTGTLTLANATPGTIDADRLPLTTLAATFAQQGEVVSLSAIDARAGDGSVRGDAALDVAHGTTSATLALTNVDLAALHGALVRSRVSGTLRARVDAATQAYDGDLADRARGLALAFAARVADRRVALSRARLTAAAGMLDGRGELALDGARDF
jgi:translocation and assembly module TamB